MTRFTLALAAMTVAGGPALAECPTSIADAEAGIYVQFEDYVVRYDRHPDGRVEEVEFATAGSIGYRYVSQFGIFVLESSEMEFGATIGGSEEVITYDVPLPEAIRPGLSYSGNTVVRYGTDAPFDEMLQLNVGPQSTVTIGNCTLQTHEVRMTTGPSSDAYNSVFTYFPALGFAMYTGGWPAGGDPEIYEARYIGTVPPTSSTAPPPGVEPPPNPAPVPTQPTK